MFPRVAIKYASARILAKIGAASINITPSPLEPLYLREPHITQPKIARV